VVHAGGGSVTARGTVFDVGLTPDRRVVVRLIEGTVDVRQAAVGAATKQSVRLLHAGQSLSFPAARAGMAPDAITGGSNAGSGAGQAEQPARNFDSIALADIVRLANRGSPRPIRLADPATGRLRVSGTFRIDDSDVLATRIALLFGLVQDRRDPSAIVLRPK
jgi:transmembrane sensor